MPQIASQIPRSLANFLQKINYGSDKWQGLAGEYLLGLGADYKRFSLQSLAESSTHYTYRQWEYFLCQSSWSAEELNEQRLAFIQSDQRTRMTEDGLVVIDDTGHKKYGDKTDGVAWQYLGQEGRVTRCKTEVTSHYAESEGDKSYPLDLLPYTKGKISKLSLACQLLKKSKLRNSHLVHTALDAWYAKKEVIKYIEELGMFFYCPLASNRRIVYENQSMSVSGPVKATAASLAGSQGYLDLGRVYVKNLGTYRLVLYRDGQEIKNILTNNLTFPPQKLIAFYQKRWSIDHFYREVKDNLAFGQFQVRSDKAITRHWYLVFLAYTFYLHSRVKGVFSKVYQGVLKTLGDFRKILQNLNLAHCLKEGWQKGLNVFLPRLKLRLIN